MANVPDLRDAIAAKITAELAGDEIPVDVVVVPDYQRDELKGPRVCVMSQGFNPQSLQELDRNVATIGIGVLGPRKPATGSDYPSAKGYRQQDVAAMDSLEALIRQVVELWVPDGPLSDERLAGYRFQTIERPVPLDVDTYRERGIWMSVLLLTYAELEDY